MSKMKNNKFVKDIAKKAVSSKIDDVTTSVNNTVKEMFNLGESFTQTYTDEERKRFIEQKAQNIFKNLEKHETIDHPIHYGGDKEYEVIKVIENWDLGFHLGNVVKYIYRAGIKDPSTEIEDLEKAAWYIRRRINLLKGEK